MDRQAFYSFQEKAFKAFFIATPGPNLVRIEADRSHFPYHFSHGDRYGPDFCFDLLHGYVDTL
jgi:hypothetical protein